MKNLLLLIALNVFLVIHAHSQTVNGIPIEDIETPYIQIMGVEKFLSTKVKIELDFGQRDKVWNFKDLILLDDKGKRLVFNSMVDALNFFSGHGYEMQQAYAFAVGKQSVYHYLMKRRSAEEILPEKE